MGFSDPLFPATTVLTFSVLVQCQTVRRPFLHTPWTAWQRWFWPARTISKLKALPRRWGVTVKGIFWSHLSSPAGWRPSLTADALILQDRGPCIRIPLVAFPALTSSPIPHPPSFFTFTPSKHFPPTPPMRCCSTPPGRSLRPETGGFPGEPPSIMSRTGPAQNRCCGAYCLETC